MKSDIKQRWVTALRTGEIDGKPIEQARGYLRREDVDGVMQLCCLGVLCEIAASDGIVKAQQAEYNTGRSYFYHERGNDVVLPTAVMKWASLSGTNPVVDGSEYDNGEENLAALNDSYSYSFAQIADVIENSL